MLPVALVALVAVLAAAGVEVLLPAAAGVPLACPCNAATRFWMKACMASCGVCVLLLDEVDEVLDARSDADALDAAAELPPVAAVAAELAWVIAPDCVSACISASRSPPAGVDDDAPCDAPELPDVPEVWVELPIMPTWYCCCCCQRLLIAPMLMLVLSGLALMCPTLTLPRAAELSIALHSEHAD